MIKYSGNKNNCRSRKCPFIITKQDKGTSSVGLYQCIHIDKLVCVLFPFSATAPTLFIVSDLQDFTLLALNHLTADPYNDYQGISEAGSLYNAIFILFSPRQMEHPSFCYHTQLCDGRASALSAGCVGLDQSATVCRLITKLGCNKSLFRAERQRILLRKLNYYTTLNMCCDIDYPCK